MIFVLIIDDRNFLSIKVIYNQNIFICFSIFDKNVY